MNVNTYTCTFINGVAFDDELVYNQTVRILNSIEKASPFKVIPTTELIKAFRNYLETLKEDSVFADMLDACFWETPITKILQRLKHSEHALIEHLVDPTMAPIILNVFKPIVELVENDKAFYIVFTAKSIESLTIVLDSLTNLKNNLT